MAIIINIDVMLAKRKMSVTELSEKVGINGKYFRTKKWKGKSNQSRHIKQDLPGVGLPAGRYFRICSIG